MKFLMSFLFLFSFHSYALDEIFLNQTDISLPIIGSIANPTELEENAQFTLVVTDKTPSKVTLNYRYVAVVEECLRYAQDFMGWGPSPVLVYGGRGRWFWGGWWGPPMGSTLRCVESDFVERVVENRLVLKFKNQVKDSMIGKTLNLKFKVVGKFFKYDVETDADVKVKIRRRAIVFKSKSN